MKKVTHREYFGGYELDSNKKEPLDELINFLVKAQINGATHIQFSGCAYDGEIETVDMNPVKLVFETDYEYQERVDKEEEERKQRRVKRFCKDVKRIEATRCELKNEGLI